MAVWTPHIADTVISYIDKAQQSLDITMYEQESPQIVDAINAAYDRGVQVRYITDDNGNNPALANLNVNIPVLYGNPNGIMHDKFILIDAGSEMDAWVITGSLNHTVNNLGWDFNNMICIQDQSLAKGFTLEFEEMWGSNGPMFNETNARFGDDKTDNTPHVFRINNIPMELYFSPSDNTTAHIKSVIDQAESDLEFGIMVFTENSLGDAVVNASQSGLNIRGIIDYVEYSGSEYQNLKDNGVNVREYLNPDGSQWPDGPVFHHKYAVMDFEQGDANPVVITGSHNWSASAESINDENTLIMYDANLANQFHQEFSQRFNDLLTPVAVNDDTSAYSNIGLTIDYLANDFIPEDVMVSAEIIEYPSSGNAAISSGEMTYQSLEGFVGKDSLSYQLVNSNNTQLADTAWVTITVGENSIGEHLSNNFKISRQSVNEGILYLDIHSSKAEIVQIKLFGISGKLLYAEKVHLVPGKNPVHINLSSLAKGVALINIFGRTGSISSKLVY